MNMEVVCFVPLCTLRDSLDGASPLWNKGVLACTTYNQRGAPLQAWQSHDLMSSDTPAMEQLQDFLRQRRTACQPAADLDALAQELQRLFVAAEREALGRELARFEVDVPASHPKRQSHGSQQNGHQDCQHASEP